MEEELKRIVAQAVARGATQEEIRRIVEEYNASKKKEEPSRLGSPLATRSSTDSSFVPSAVSLPQSTGSGGFRVSTIDDVYDRPLEINGFVLSSNEETALKGYVDKYDGVYNKYVYDNFNVVDYFNSYGGRRAEQFRNASQEELDQVKQDVLNNIDSEYGLQSYDGVTEILRGIDKSFSSMVPQMRGIAESAVAGSIPVSQRAKDFAFEGTYDDLFKRERENASVRFRNAVTRDISQDVLTLMPDYMKQDKQARNDLEKLIWNRYQVALDLNQDGYINKDEDRTWMHETWDGLLASAFELSAAVPQMNVDAFSYLAESLGWDATAEGLTSAGDDWRAWTMEKSKDMRKDMRISLNTLSEKIDSGDVSGGINDGLAMIGESIPMMSAAIVAGAVTKNPRITAGVTSLVGMGTSYHHVRDEEWFQELDAMGKSLFIASDGVAEGLPAFVGANIFNRMRALGKAKNITTPKMVAGYLSGIGLGATEEGVTEAFTAAWQYSNRVAANPDMQWDWMQFDKAVKDGWYGGVIMGTGFAGTGAAVGLAARGASLAVSSIPSLRSKIRISELQQEYDNERDPVKRAELGKRLIEAVQGAEDTRKSRRDFYDFLSQTAPEAFEKIASIQTQISKLSMEHNKSRDGKERGRLKKQIRALVDERAALEAEYNFQFETDSKAERDAILKRVAGVDELFSGYGELFGEGQNSVTVDNENSDSTLERILNASFEKLNLDLGQGIGTVTTAKEVRRGMVNAVRVAQAMGKMGVSDGIVVHKTLESMQSATQGRAARGMAFQDGKIHILAPALRANTAYHEMFHTFVVQELGQGASRKFAAELAKGMGSELLEKIQKRLEEDMGAVIPNMMTAIKRGDFQYADEFLVEVLADITDGALSVEVQKGLLRQFAEVLAPTLSRVGVKLNANPKIQDLADAITAMTGAVAEGESTTATEVAKALETRRVRGIKTDEQEDREVKAQGIRATVSFQTPNGRRWNVTRVFNDDKHIDNFVKYVERTRGYTMDEVYREQDDVKYQGDLVKDTKARTVQGQRIGQGRASRVSAGETVTDPGSNDGTLDVSVAAMREKDPKGYVQNAKYLANLDIVKSVNKFQDRVFSGKNAMEFADEVYDIFVSEVSDNLLFLHDQFNDKLRDIATLWYDGANIIAQELAGKHDMTVEQTSAVIAALSPQKDWYQNLRLAEIVIEFMKDVAPNLTVSKELVDFHKRGGKAWAKDLEQYIGRPFTEITNGADAAAILWAYADTKMDKEYAIVSPNGERGDLARKKDGTPKMAAWGSRSMIASAMDAVFASTQEQMSEILGNQHKIRNFFNNIANPSSGSDATIDTHAVAAAHLKPFAGSNAEVMMNLGGSKAFVAKDGQLYSLEDVKKLAKTKSASEANAYAAKKGLKVLNVKSNQGAGLSGMYYAYLDAYRKAAEERGILPREMQSITWEAVRLLYTAGFKQSSRNKADIEALHRKYTNGELTKQQLRDALLERADGIGNPDWADVFTEPERTGTGIGDTRGVPGEGRGAGGQGARARGTDVVREQVPPVQSDGTATGDAKLQGDLTRKIADFLDKTALSPKVRGKKKIVLEDVPGGTLDAFTRRKKEILELLEKMGYSKELAEQVYQNAKAYKQGRTQGKRSGMKVARKAEKEARKLGAEAQRLKQDLDRVKEKSKTVNEFFAEAIKLVEERMKGKGQQPFSRQQIERLFRIARMAHKVSAKNVEQQGMAAMQTFIDKLSSIFDQQDAKEAMGQYLDKVNKARKIQSRLAKMSKVRKKGEPLKGTATYRRAANALSRINPALLPQQEIDNFLATLAGTLESMSKAYAEKVEEGGYEGVAPMKIQVEALNALVSNFQAMEEMGMDAVLVARAANAAQRNGTTFDEEYDKIKKKYESSRLSPTVRKIRDYIDAHNENNPNDQLDPANPADIEKVLADMSQDSAEVQEEKKMAIINDVVIPRVAANLTKLMEDKHVRDILGFFHEGDFDADALRSRLGQLSLQEVANIDYKLDDYVVNDSVFGLGYVAYLVKGKIDYAVGLSRLGRRLGLRANDRIWLESLHTIDSMIRNLFPINNIDNAKLRRFLGFGGMEGSFAEADAMHARIMTKLEEKVEELGKKDVTTVRARAIAQIFSMSRQIPQGAEATVEEAGIWYNSLRDIMRRTIDDKAKQPNTTEADIKELNDAYDFLFKGTKNLDELQQKVEQQEAKVVELVDYVVQIHDYILPMFQNYVERFLGKELLMEDNYTAFDVRSTNEDVEVEQMLQLRRGMLEALRSTALSNAKKVAGGSFERNPRSITGKNNTIGLDFLSVNERRIRENIILSKTVGDVIAMRFVFKSEALAEIMPQKSHRKALETKMMGYIQQDTGTVPTLFRPNISVFGKRVPNPMSLLREAVVVKAFGSLGLQTLKQGGVVLSAMAQFQHPLKAIPYLSSTIGEMLYFSIKTGFRTDAKIVLDKNGRYRLLENSPVFSRDYESGNIDPFTGSMRFDSNRLGDIKKVLTDAALKNLKGTDKVAAVATWFAYYGDFLINTGKVDSFSQIDWEAEADRPNVEALSYADGMVTKDQAASTPRQAADAFRDQGDAKGNMVRVLRTFVLPFSRFAVNKKMSILGDGLKIYDGLINKNSKILKEGSSAMLGHTVELAAFHAVGQILVPFMLSLIAGDEEDEVKSSKEKRKPWARVTSGVVNDMLPIPPFPVVDDYINYGINKYVVFGAEAMMNDDYAAKSGESYDDRYQRWLNIKGFVPVYKSEFDPNSGMSGIVRMMGPYGDYVLESMNLLENASTGGNKVVSVSGKEFYVRPEDKADMDLSINMRAAIALMSLGGFSIKELELLAKKFDDLPVSRSLSSEEELAAYEMFAASLAEDDYFKDVIAAMEGTTGADRLIKVISDKIEQGNLLDAMGGVTKAKGGLKQVSAEYLLRNSNPDLYKKYIQELRYLDKYADKEDLSVLMRTRRDDMTKEEYKEFETAVTLYFGYKKKSTLENSMVLESLYNIYTE